MYLVIKYRVIDIDSSTANCQDLVLTAVDQHVPRMKLRGISRRSWIDKDVLRLVRTKKALWKHLKFITSLDLTIKFKFLRALPLSSIVNT